MHESDGVATPVSSPVWRLLVRGQSWVMASLVFIALGVKCLLLQRLNINWDEFYYLSFVHAVRNDMPVPLFQTLHVRFFAWLPSVVQNEAGQVLAARHVMFVGLIATTLMLWRLARLWVQGWAGWVAPMVYLMTLPVFRHGASFRTDSLVAPLVLGGVLLLFLPGTRKRFLVAGGLFGLSLAISIKAALAAPMLLMILFLAEDRGHWQLRERLLRCLGFGLCAGLTAFVCLAMHGVFLTPSEASGAMLVTNAASRTILDQSLFPTLNILQRTWLIDRAVWILIAGGTLIALSRRQFAVASCALSLLPLVFYRNAFPYYYVVMLAPAAVLAAVCVARVFDGMGAIRNFRLSALILWFALVALFVAKLFGLWGGHRSDMVSHQVAIVDAVHVVFPVPVPYIDHSGMIGSFPKANFFMSSWGMSEYLAAGVPFTDEAVGIKHAPMVLANRGMLFPEAKMFNWLLPRDRDVIAQHYLAYWGPIRIAGGEVRICSPHDVPRLTLPYAGEYRIHSDRAVLIDGHEVADGAIMTLGTSVSVSVPDSPGCEAGGGGGALIRILDARAVGRPSAPEPSRAIYDGL